MRRVHTLLDRVLQPVARIADDIVNAKPGRSPASFEILHRALVFLSLGPRGEGAEITPSPRPRVDLARVEPILTGLQFSDHSPASRLIPTTCPREVTHSQAKRLGEIGVPANGWTRNSTNAAARA